MLVSFKRQKPWESNFVRPNFFRPFHRQPIWILKLLQTSPFGSSSRTNFLGNPQIFFGPGRVSFGVESHPILKDKQKNKQPSKNTVLVGGFNPPLWKILYSQIGSWNPKVRGENKTCLLNHHPVFYVCLGPFVLKGSNKWKTLFTGSLWL